MAQDSIARGMAVAATKSPLIGAPSFQGMHIFGGRSETTVAPNSAGGRTFELAMEVPARSPIAIGNVFPILGMSRSSFGSQAAFVSVKPIAALADLDATWSATACTYGDGASTAGGLLNPASASRRRYHFPDDTQVSPVSRSDGGTKPLLSARAFMNDINSVYLGKSGDDFTSWASRAAGLARFRLNSTGGDQRTATSNWSAVSYGPIVGFAYSHESPIFCGMGIGDSIDEGRGTYLNESMGLLACEAINALSPKTWQSFSNLAWSGQTMAQIAQNVLDTLDDGLVPDWLIFPAGSPNDVTPGQPITTTIVDGWRLSLIRILGQCARFGIAPVIRNVMPVNYSVQQWGASDSLRIAYNTEVQAMCATSGIPYVDASAAMAGTVEGHGQMEISASLTVDGIHPNTAGYVILAGLVKTALQSLMRGYL